LLYPLMSRRYHCIQYHRLWS